MSVGSFLTMAWRLRDLGRANRIGSVLARNGFEEIFTRLGFFKFKLFRSRNKADAERRALPIEVRIRLALQDLGPTFVKLGQMMATRPDLVPMSLIQELLKLQDRVPPFDFPTVKSIVEEDLKRPMSEVFESFDETPIGAASIGQVHCAKLIGGQEVVVKVQRPKLHEVIAADLRILATFAGLLEKHLPEVQQFRPVAIVDEFKRSLSRETDYRMEMNSMLRFARNFADEPGLHVPKPYPELSTGRVLVMERVYGVKVTDVEKLREMGIDPKTIVSTGMRITLRSIFDFGFFHADPHPGNFFIRSDGTIALLDYGMMGSIESRRIDELLGFIVAILGGDLDMVVGLLLDADLIGDDTDLRAMRTELSSILDNYKGQTLANVDVSSFLQEVLEVVMRHHVMMPADLVLIGKALSTMEGIGRQIQPDFNPVEEIRPYLTEVYVRRVMDAKKYSQGALRSAMDGLSLLKDAPFEVRRILRKMRRGELALVLEDPHADRKLHAAALRTNRAIFAALFPAFFFAGVGFVEMDSTWSILAGVVSLGFSWVFFLGLMVSMFRSEGGRT